MSIRFLSGVNVDSNTLFVDDANNRVGIGTASPNEKLQVTSGDISIRSSSGAWGSLRFGTTNSSYLTEWAGIESDWEGVGVNVANLKFYTSYGSIGERMRITSVGNVGIGTTSPNAPLHVIKDLGTSVSAVTRLRGSNSTARTTRLQFEDYNGTLADGLIDFVIPTAGSATGARLDIGVDSAIVSVVRGGNVGIGTTSPQAVSASWTTLEVQGKSSGGGGIVYTANNGATVKSHFYSDGTSGFVGTQTNHIFGFTTNNNEVARFTTGGNLLIGTTTDGGQKLQVNGPSAFLHASGTSQTNISIFQNTTNNAYLSVSAAGTSSAVPTWVDGSMILEGVAYSTGATIISAYTGKLILQTGSRTNRLEISSAGALKLNAYGSGSNTGTATQRLAVDASGNVIEIPIGSGPVDGNGTANYVTKWSDTDTITNSIIYDNGTNVGIGNTSPTAKLQVGAEAHPSATGIEVAAGTGGANLLALNNSTNHNWFPFTDGKNYYSAIEHTFRNELHSTDWMKITSAGNVGIGTTSPGSKLNIVDGFIRVQGTEVDQFFLEGLRTGTSTTVRIYDNSSIAFYDSYSSTIFRANQLGGSGGYIGLFGGNVGVNEVAPSQRLHITGNIRVTGAYYDSNNEAGTSGQVLTSTGSGTDWVTPATTTATSLYDLLPAARVAYNWTGQVVDDTWTTIFSKSDNILTTGTWMVKMYVNDFAVGGGHYQYVYSGIMTWEQGTVNQTGEAAFSEIYLHRMGHAANASVLYLRTAESGAAASNLGYFQIKGNYSNTSNQTIQFQFVKIF